MREHGFLLLAILLIVSIILNGVLLVALRSQYIGAKIRATQPHGSEMFASDNAQLRADRTASPLVVLFGDSRVAQWRPAPDRDDDRWRTVNRGVSGETTEQMRLRYRSDVIEVHPDIVVIQAGINDLVAASLASPSMQEKIVQQCIENLRTFAQRAAADGIDVIVLTIFPPANPPLYRRLVWDRSILSLVDEVNQELIRLRSDPRISIVDSTDLLVRDDGNWYEDASRDTLHLTSEGYERLNAAVEPTINRLLGDAVQ